MKNFKEFAAGIVSYDKSLLYFNEANFGLRENEPNYKLFYSLNGEILQLVNEKGENGPNTILCRNLPTFDSYSDTKDGWQIKSGKLLIPYAAPIELKNYSQFDSAEQIILNDYPGHMRSMLNRLMRKESFKKFHKLEERLRKLGQALKETSTEVVEMPLLEVIGFGNSKLADGDAALCGMLLTARSFAAGKRFKVNWYPRLSVELRRLKHRSTIYGQNWLGFALDGRMTESQQIFFKTMTRDFESVDEMVLAKISGNKTFNGKAFLTGVSNALDMIQKQIY